MISARFSKPPSGSEKQRVHICPLWASLLAGTKVVCCSAALCRMIVRVPPHIISPPLSGPQNVPILGRASTNWGAVCGPPEAGKMIV